MRYIQCRETHKLLTEQEWLEKYGMEKVETHFVQPDIPDYQSPVDDQWVSGRKARRSDLARHNSRPWEGMEQEKKEANRVRQYNEQKAEREVFKAVEQQFMKLDERTRRQLGA